MSICYVLLFILTSFDVVFSQDTAGKLRVCVVKESSFYSYIKHDELCSEINGRKSGVECVFGVDKFDCLRRISNDTADFGVFEPEQLVAAQWANLDIIVTNELRKDGPFKNNIVALVNKRIVPDEGKITGVTDLLRNKSLCFPVEMKKIFLNYIESLVIPISCDPGLSLIENRVKALSEFFSKTCHAAPWVEDAARNAEFKLKYPSLCAGCASPSCTGSDMYWGGRGVFNCMEQGAGDVTWMNAYDVQYFTQSNDKASIADQLGILCQDGSLQPLRDNNEPCVWLQEPWPVIATNRKSSEIVGSLLSSLNFSLVTGEPDWRRSLAELLDTQLYPPEPLQPPLTYVEYLANAKGYKEAYSHRICDNARHLTICTASTPAYNKCRWLGEAGLVQGLQPPLQCVSRDDIPGCLRAVRDGQSDVTTADSDWLVTATRDYSLQAVLHEADFTVDDANTVVAYVRKNAKIARLTELRGKRVSFPKFDGFAFHSVLNYLRKQENSTCKDVAKGYFSEICAPGIEEYSVTDDVKEVFTKNCYKDGEKAVAGEVPALRAVVEGLSDVAFVSMRTYNLYKERRIDEPWAKDPIQLDHVCAREKKEFCFIGWSNLGYVFAANNETKDKLHEIVSVFQKFHHIFGSKGVFKKMFSLYGSFDEQPDVLFHNNTQVLLTDSVYKPHPSDREPASFESTFEDSCDVKDIIAAFM